MNELLPSAPISYMKGKSRHWFWPLLAVLLFSGLFEVLFSILAPSLIISTEARGLEYLPVMISTIRALLQMSCWAALLVIYCIKNTVKTYKLLFIILALIQLPSAISIFLFNLFITNIWQHNVTDNIINLLTISDILLHITSVAWVTCLLVIVFNRKTSNVLRISAILLALYYIYGSVYLLAYGPIMQSLANIINPDIQQTISKIMEIVNTCIYIAASAFFFAAMSFGRQKQPKAKAIANTGAAVL